ncbi:hypothetical protein VT569_04975 [Flavobacterium psychrophilum]|uniref:hypothetical protein n=1 Tax=Flavobacterium psychrophilum TaxID=96345 RepID=UPI003B435668
MNGLLKILMNYQKASMRNSKLNRVKLAYWYENENFIVENPSKNTYSAILISGILSIFIFVAFFSLFTAKIDFISFIILLIFGVYGLRQFLWLINGIEKIEIDKENLYVKRTGSFLKKSSTYQLKKIKSVKAKTKNIQGKTEIEKHILEIQESFHENHSVFFGYHSDDIFFKYGFETISILNDLNNEQKELIISEIESRIV